MADSAVSAVQANLAQNQKFWEDPFVWKKAGMGDVWGSPQKVFELILDPVKGQLGPFLPKRPLKILELSPGAGRCTQLLIPLACELCLVDLSAECLRMCRERFKDTPFLTYHQTDGQSLAIVPDGRFDLFFCFDSMVHMDKAIVVGYVKQAAQKLVPGGLAYLHYAKNGPVRLGWRSNMSHAFLLENLPGTGFEVASADLTLSHRDAYTVLRKGASNA